QGAATPNRHAGGARSPSGHLVQKAPPPKGGRAALLPRRAAGQGDGTAAAPVVAARRAALPRTRLQHRATRAKNVGDRERCPAGERRSTEWCRPMPSAVYQPKPWGGVPLAAIFHHLTKVAGVSRYAARAMMTDMLEREPPLWLPPSWRLIFTADGGITVRTPDGDIPGERILMRYRGVGESGTHHQPDEGLRGTPANTPP